MVFVVGASSSLWLRAVVDPRVPGLHRRSCRFLRGRRIDANSLLVDGCDRQPGIVEVMVHGERRQPRRGCHRVQPDLAAPVLHRFVAVTSPSDVLAMVVVGL